MTSRTLAVRAAASFLLALSHLTLAEPQERAFLDATQTQIRQREREPATGSGGFSSSAREGEVPPAQPFAVSLRILGPRELERNQTFDYEIQIRNMSSKSLELPWDLSPADIEPSDPHATYQYQLAAIVLQGRLGEGRPVTLNGSILLFGTPSIASTTVKLEPGQWLRLKSKATAAPWNPNDPWPPPGLNSERLSGTVEARLLVEARSFQPPTSANHGNSHEDTRPTLEPISSNAVTVQFRF